MVAMAQLEGEWYADWASDDGGSEHAENENKESSFVQSVASTKARWEQLPSWKPIT